ncbi:hypothetical protein OOK27_05695 [Streptomyces canus]|uniref:hypothetical protein n=1 Tax=Streptomyces canus TaxID=58343 RepID=UPI00225827F2|nr:hypothetical protein [Streptomyces canus]MCX5253668.1 hypothetical protein [Streptomyces canus]
MSLDPKSPSMKLWHRLLAAGVSDDEATELMHGYAHELADRQRAALDDVIDRYERTFHQDAFTDLIAVIDPQAQQPPVDEYRLSTRRPVVSGGS